MDVTGNYKVKTHRLSGDCPNSGEDGEITVTVSRDNGTLLVAFPGVEGGCPADLNASTCKLTALCKIFDTKTNATLATFNVDYTFNEPQLSGTLAGAINPPLAATACTANASHNGTKL